jgi:hypothetical protein
MEKFLKKFGKIWAKWDFLGYLFQNNMAEAI